MSCFVVVVNLYFKLKLTTLFCFFISAIIPKKKTRNNPLTQDDLARNNRISSDRVIVENFFGRVCMMFGIMGTKYRWGREKFGLIVDFCFSLANFHIRLHPLCEQDGEYYLRVLADMKRRMEVSVNQVKKRQQKHRARQARMRAVMEGLDEEVHVFGGVSAEVPATFLADEDGELNIVVCFYCFFFTHSCFHCRLSCFFR